MTQAVLRRQRTALCEACDTLNLRWEICTESGHPLGQFLQNPKPRVLKGSEVTTFVREHPEAVPGLTVV